MLRQLARRILMRLQRFIQRVREQHQQDLADRAHFARYRHWSRRSSRWAERRPSRRWNHHRH